MFCGQERHIGGHAGTGHYHCDGADRAGIGAESVADAFVSVHDDCFARDQGEHVSFRAHRSTSAAPDAVTAIDVGMLCFGAIRKHLSLLRRLQRTGFPLLQISHVDENEEQSDEGSDAVSDQRIHSSVFKGPVSEISKKELQSNVNYCQHSEGIAERLVNYVPQMKDFL